MFVRVVRDFPLLGVLNTKGGDWILLVLVTKCPYMNSFYEDSLYKGVYYLGYCDDEDTAELYAKQFKYSSEYYVYSVEVTDEFFEVLRTHCTTLTEINKTWSPIKKKYFAFSDSEIDYLDELLCDSNGTEFDDLQYAIENLERFCNTPYVKKTVKRLKALYKILTEFPDSVDESKFGFKSSDEIYENIDTALNHWFIANRVGLFDCREYFNERCGGGEFG